MSAKNKGIWALVIILVAAGIVFFSKKDKQPEQKANDAKSGTELKKATDEEKKDLSSSTNGKILEGILQVSDNKKKGNLMIVINDKTLYIYTSRDFSKLIGKEVIVTYEGTLDEFVLGDITAK